MPLTTTYISLAVGVALVVVGLFVVGWRDLRRFSVYRTWAVGGVVFRESIRRRVLWVTPLAMLATLLLVRLQDPASEEDAIRQAIKFCLFASALVVVVVCLVLACTNLPREIENRVIFTIVTKPVTRLELLLGKIIGFARLNVVILLIMGAFSYVLLLGLDWHLTGQIRQRLESPLPQESRRPYLEHLARTGLLDARGVNSGDDLQLYAVPPDDANDASIEPRFFYPGAYFAAVPFELPDTLLEQIDAQRNIEIRIHARLHWKLMPWHPILPGDPPLGIVNLENLPDPPPPHVRLQVLDSELFNVIASPAIMALDPQLPADPGAPWEEAATYLLGPAETLRVAEAASRGPIHMAVYGVDSEYLYGVGPQSMRLEFLEAGNEGTGDGKLVTTLDPSLPNGPRSDILLRTYLGSVGMGISGPEENVPPPTAVLAFRDTADVSSSFDDVIFELRPIVERTGGVLDENVETEFRAQVINVTSGFASNEQYLTPETNQPTLLRVARQAVEGGNFDLHLTTLTPGHVVSLRGQDVQLIVNQQPFVLNLAKALLVQWLLGLLVIAAGLTFSTFVSWPVAVTMTLVLLLGRWVAQQLGGALESGGLGRQVAQDLFGESGDAGAREAVRVGVDTLTDAFTLVTSFLPDVDVYGATTLVERGLILDWGAIGSAALMTGAFVLPLLALGYLVLRRKEVAP